METKQIIMNYNDLRAALYIIENYSVTEIQRMMELSKDIDSNILEMVCRDFKVTPKQVKSKSRKGNIKIARFITIYLLRKYGELPSLKEIGMFLGGRDHSTILHSLRQVDNYIDTGFKVDAINKLEEEVKYFLKTIKGEL